MSGKLDLLNKEWCDMVFEDRNQEYGAFELRKLYSKNIILGVILTAAIFALSIAGPIVARLISDAIPQEEIIKQTEVTTLEEPPPIDKNEPPPPPVEPPPPLKSTVKFTPPEIVPDKEVPDEPPPTQEDLKEVDASTKTQEGSDDGVDQSLLEGNGNQVVEEPAAPEIFVTVEQMPEFPGGVEELYKFLGNNIKYPQMEKEAGIQGTVYLRFYIDANGKPNDITVARGVKGGPNLEQEAIRVLKVMPSWNPGKQNGKAVNVWYSLPIKFTLR